MTRYIVPVLPCDKCNSEMSICETDEDYDAWGISKCTNPKCKGWKDATQLIKQGGVVKHR